MTVPFHSRRLTQSLVRGRSRLQPESGRSSAHIQRRRRRRFRKLTDLTIITTAKQSVDTNIPEQMTK
jgi:hypothetical protein